MNDLDCEEVAKIDKRTFFEHYISLIKTKHILFVTFSPNSDYNHITIKICFLLFNFVLNYTINTLFFTDSTMNKIYEDEGIFNFIYLLPKMVYSIILSSIIIFFIRKLSSANNDILNIKKNNDIKECEIDVKLQKLIKYIQIKYLLFFIFSFIFLILFCYYISCFNAVYKNTQSILIKDTLISFGFSILYPFIIYLISSAIRTLSLHKSYKMLECIYKFSKVL